VYTDESDIILSAVVAAAMLDVYYAGAL